MVELNFDHRRPEYLLDLDRIAELREWEVGEEHRAPRGLRALQRDHPEPARRAARSGARRPTPSAPRRSATAAVSAATSARPRPAGDAHPALLAAGAEVEAVSVRGARRIPIDDFYTRRQTQRARRRRADPRRAHQEGGRPPAVLQGRHPQRDGHRRVRLRHRPAPRDPHGAHRHRLRGAHPGPGHDRRGVPERGARRGRLLGQRPQLTPSVARQFAELVSGAGNPIDDVRGTATYRRHAVSVMARRTLGWVWEEYRGTGGTRKEAHRARDLHRQRRPYEADDVWEGESLLYVLRERMGLPGSKNACEQGECGSCTVRLDGEVVCACLVAAGQVAGPRGSHGRGSGRPGRRVPRPRIGRRGRRTVHRAAALSWTRAPCSAASAHPGCWWPPTS